MQGALLVKEIECLMSFASLNVRPEEGGLAFCARWARRFGLARWERIGMCYLWMDGDGVPADNAMSMSTTENLVCGRCVEVSL